MGKPENKITKAIVTQLRGNSRRERLLHRLHSVVLVLKGYSSSETARIYGDSARAVAYWVKRFKQDGCEGLKEESRPGRPSKLNATQYKRLQTIISKSKGNSKKENAEMLSVFISKEFKISMTPRQCWRILNRLTVNSSA
jgi:transposase